MTSNEIARRLRALADEIDAANPFKARPADEKPVSQKPETRPAQPAADEAEIEVTYYEVRTSANGNPFASVGHVVDGERVFWKCFDADLLARVDPIRRGDRIRVRTQPWNETRKIVGIEKLGSAPPRKGIEASEIPF